ncbi:MAG: pyrroloquinoline quinone-dependent dehydrogenase [Lysobacterales bacterium]
MNIPLQNGQKLDFAEIHVGLWFLLGLLIFTGNTLASETHNTVLNNQGWEAFGGVQSGGQYSALDQINANNVSQLTRAWTAHTGDFVVGKAAEGGSSFQATPLYRDGKLFICTPMNRVIALDAVSGKQIWAFDGQSTLPESTPRFAANCRGLSLWVDSAGKTDAHCAVRIIKPDIFGRLTAIDANTGTLCKSFGDNGVVNLNAFDNGGEGNLFLTSPPAIYKDLIITGSGVADNVVANAADGIVRAINAKDGTLAWEFNPIPSELSASTGGANVWSALSVDSEAGLVYLPTTSPSVDPYGAARTQPIPFANALVALAADTGKVAWSFQTVHHDLFDYDLPTQPLLFDLKKDGEQIPVVVQVTKTGYTFMFNRLTGKSIFPISEIAVPTSSIATEKASPTQPAPGLPAPFARQELSREDLWGITFLGKQACQKRFDQLRYEGLFTPPSIEGTLQIPSALGGSNWGGAAIDPGSGLLIVKTQNLASIIRLVPADPDKTRPAGSPLEFLKKPLNGTPYRLEGEFFLAPSGIPCTPPPWGELVAIDLSSGKQLWRRPLGRYPVSMLKTPEEWGSPNVGGPIVTAGGLVFIGAGMDNTFRAISSKSGATLWEDKNLPAPAMAVPMTYQVDGTQYVVVAAGGNALAETQQSDALVAYRLK